MFVLNNNNNINKPFYLPVALLLVMEREREREKKNELKTKTSSLPSSRFRSLLYNASKTRVDNNYNATMVTFLLVSILLAANVLLGLAVDSSIVLEDFPLKRKLMMHRGDGNNTKVFGGGLDPNVPFDPRREALNLIDMSAIPASNDEPSLGQARWAAKNIFQQVELYDKARNQEPKSPRVFVEFGSRDGVFESNTYWFEKALKWEGMLIDAGRDYMHNLREKRSCRLNQRVGSCVFAALAAEEDKTLYWSSVDVVRAKPDLTRYGVKHGSAPEAQAPTAEDRAVKTMTLNHLLHHFGVTHVDFMSVDCEGCEGAALQGLNLDHYHVDVFTIETPNCDIAWMLNRRGYTLLVVPFSFDTFFVSPSVVQKMSKAPDLVSCEGMAKGTCSQDLVKQKVERLEVCNTSQQKLSIWTPQDAWPPSTTSSSNA